MLLAAAAAYTAKPYFSRFLSLSSRGITCNNKWRILLILLLSDGEKSYFVKVACPGGGSWWGLVMRLLVQVKNGWRMKIRKCGWHRDVYAPSLLLPSYIHFLHQRHSFLATIPPPSMEIDFINEVYPSAHFLSKLGLQRERRYTIFGDGHSRRWSPGSGRGGVLVISKLSRVTLCFVHNGRNELDNAISWYCSFC